MELVLLFTVEMFRNPFLDVEKYIIDENYRRITPSTMIVSEELLAILKVIALFLVLTCIGYKYRRF